MDITYEGPASYAQISIDNALPFLSDEHTNYMNAPSVFLALADGTKLHVIAYNRPKKGVRIVCWKQEK